MAPRLRREMGAAGRTPEAPGQLSFFKEWSCRAQLWGRGEAAWAGGRGVSQQPPGRIRGWARLLRVSALVFTWALSSGLRRGPGWPHQDAEGLPTRGDRAGSGGLKDRRSPRLRGRLASSQPGAGKRLVSARAGEPEGSGRGEARAGGWLWGWGVGGPSRRLASACTRSPLTRQDAVHPRRA